MLGKISKKGQITIPAEVRRRLGLREGSAVRFLLDGEGARIVLADRGIEALKGAVPARGPQDFESARHRALEEAARERSQRG